ncbi:MAG: hypothetical protein KatS3mg120_2849 [Erythrobacter sp.]|nr:MAG: hypothetical protein KatS3mg120_2849 [Erythrobacter sp.]
MSGPVAPAAPRPTSSAARSASLSPERAALRQAAEGFEAMLLRQLLASARASSWAQETPLTGGAMEQWRSLRDEHLADIAARSGAFGFARSIEASLAQHLPVHTPIDKES